MGLNKVVCVNLTHKKKLEDENIIKVKSIFQRDVR